MTRHRFREIVVHVGQMKTGTSHIQSMLAANAARLLEAGILYPTSGAHLGAHHALARDLTGNVSDPAAMAGTPAAPEGGRMILAELETGPAAEIAMLSSEILPWAARTNPDRFRDLDAHLCTLAPFVRYVAYVREPVGGFASLSSQTLMRGAMLPRMERALAAAPLIALRDLFGARLSLRLYDRRNFPDGDVLADFLSGVLGCGVAVDGLAPTQKANISLSAEGMYLVQAVALLGHLPNPSGFPDHPEPLRQIAQFIRQVDAARTDRRAVRLRDGIAGMIAAATAGNRAILHETFGLDVPAPAAAPVPRDDRHPMFWQLVANVFALDAAQTAQLAGTLQDHRRCPAALADLLDRVPMPAAA